MWNGCYNISRRRRSDFDTCDQQTDRGIHTSSRKRTEQIVVRVTKEEYEHCQKFGNKSDYIRSLIQKSMVGEDELTEKIKEVLASMSTAELRQIFSGFPDAQVPDAQVIEPIAPQKPAQNFFAFPNNEETEPAVPQKPTQMHVTASIKNLFQQSF